MHTYGTLKFSFVLYYRFWYSTKIGQWIDIFCLQILVVQQYIFKFHMVEEEGALYPTACLFNMPEGDTLSHNLF